MSEKVRYRDLSWPLKIAAISAWCLFAVWALGFTVGVISELFNLGLA